MSVLDVFSKRRKREQGIADVFVYDSIPHKLCVQIIHIWTDAIGRPIEYVGTPEPVYGRIHSALAREYGVFRLAKGESFTEIVANFLLATPDHEKALDVIELSFSEIEDLDSDWAYNQMVQRKMTAAEAVAELNHRFLENGVGYRYANRKIIRIDSEFLHAEVTRPALALLQEREYAGANEEFLRAHEHYRHGRTKECLVDCLKAMESVLKSICKRRKWAYKETDTANTLLQVVFENELVPTYLQTHFSAVRSSLESGVPTVRNKMGGHGQGSEPVTVPSFYAAYLLNLTAANIHLLISAEKSSL